MGGTDFSLHELMYRLSILLLILIFSCADPAKKEARKEAAKKRDSVSTTQTNNANAPAVSPQNNSQDLPLIPAVKKPNGIYRVTLPLKNKIEQTIAFNSDFTYQLQEKFIAKKDSLVVTTGNWTPSDGYIWLYKDQIAGGRYKWFGDTLQYFSPVLKKGFSMVHLMDAGENITWRNKDRLGTLVYGVGNEPFWSIEVNNKDSISFQISEWDHPLKIKTSSSFNTKDSSGYVAKNDSVQIRLTIFPYFCSDGMSDFTYRNQIKVEYNQKLYKGCGIVYDTK